ncbi:MAG: ferredoxin [bacterium]
MLLQEEIEKRNLLNDIKITGCSCLGSCENGPVMVVYPEGTWYGGIRPEDVPEIVESHIVGGQPITRLLYNWPKE